MHISIVILLERRCTHFNNIYIGSLTFLAECDLRDFCKGKADSNTTIGIYRFQLHKVTKLSTHISTKNLQYIGNYFWIATAMELNQLFVHF
jgi:hypothetical protein